MSKLENAQKYDEVFVSQIIYFISWLFVRFHAIHFTVNNCEFHKHTGIFTGMQN